MADANVERAEAVKRWHPGVQTIFEMFLEQKEHASQTGNLDEEANQVPWDLRGPLRGAEEGGPDRWKRQKIRENKPTWTKDEPNKWRYSLYFKMMSQGLTGKELDWYHPLNQNGKYAGDVIEPVAA